jgi:glycerate-2-kinase
MFKPVKMGIIADRPAIESNHQGYRSLSVVLSAIERSLEYMDPKHLIQKTIKINGSTLQVSSSLQTFSLRMNLCSFDSVYLVGAGKATSKMAEALSKILGLRLSGGAINVPYLSNTHVDTKVVVTEAGHPIPDEVGVKGTEKIINILRKTKNSDLVFVLISGGASALMPLPADGIKLSDKQKITNDLLSSGASINEINIVRKHISKVKGGQLVRLIKKGCTVISLILSDVIGDDIQTIASGPTVPDTSTFKDAASVLKKYGLWAKKREHSSVINLISDGLKGFIEDTPKASDPIFDRVHNLVIGNNTLLCKKATQYLKRRGLDAKYLGSSFDGQAKSFGLLIAKLARQINKSSKPSAFILGGETTVKLNKRTKNGVGGRNQEAILTAALKLNFASGDDIAVLCMGTDGIDGNSMAAGAFITPKTVSLVKQSEMKMKKYLHAHDSYNALREVHSSIITGRTGTNLNDISIVCGIS